MSRTTNVDFATLFKEQYTNSKIYQIEALPTDVLGIMKLEPKEIDGE